MAVAPYRIQPSFNMHLRTRMIKRFVFDFEIDEFSARDDRFRQQMTPNYDKDPRYIAIVNRMVEQIVICGNCGHQLSHHTPDRRCLFSSRNFEPDKQVAPYLVSLDLQAEAYREYDRLLRFESYMQNLDRASYGSPTTTD